MNHYTFRLAVALLTFVLGVITNSVWFLARNNDVSEVKQVRRNEPTAQPEAQNEKSKFVPGASEGIDFRNRRYPYQFSDGEKFEIALKEGEFEYDIDGDRGWFSFSDVYYVDLTGDRNPETVVLLWHVSCGGSCDGGAALFYVYGARRNGPELLWRYETGSLGYGCGLKSFTVKDGKITMELFGRCFENVDEFPGMGKFQAKDITRLTFGFNGKGFVEEEKRFIPAPERDVMNYEPEINISE